LCDPRTGRKGGDSETKAVCTFKQLDNQEHVQSMEIKNFVSASCSFAAGCIVPCSPPPSVLFEAVPEKTVGKETLPFVYLQILLGSDPLEGSATWSAVLFPAYKRNLTLLATPEFLLTINDLGNFLVIRQACVPLPRLGWIG
jgi:hypothetical protein